MSWAKLDDQIFAHPKIINLSKDAKLLHLAGITYCAGQLTDGLVTPGAVRMISAQVDVDPACIAELIDGCLWEVDGKNYRIHDYLLYNPSGEQVRAERANTAKRVAEFRQRKATRNAVTNSVRNAVSNASPVPVPVPHISNPSVSLNGKVSSGEREREGESLALTRTPSPHAKSAPEKKPANRPAEPKPRPANPLWDVLVEQFYEPATPDEKKLFGKIVHDLKEARATPEDVRLRVQQHAKTQSHWDLTPRALVTHWSELGTEVNKHGTAESVRRDAAAREAALEEERARQHAEMVRELTQRTAG